MIRPVFNIGRAAIRPDFVRAPERTNTGFLNEEEH
jgi:hypothetical protein